MQWRKRAAPLNIYIEALCVYMHVISIFHFSEIWVAWKKELDFVTKYATLMLG